MIATTFTSINAARDGFTAYDRTRQGQIVADAATLEDGTAKLAAYRKQRERVLELFEKAYRSLAIAVTIEDDPKNLANLMLAAQALHEALKQFTGGGE